MLLPWQAERPSMAISSPMRTSSCLTPALGSSPWRMLDRTRTDLRYDVHHVYPLARRARVRTRLSIRDGQGSRMRHGRMYFTAPNQGFDLSSILSRNKNSRSKFQQGSAKRSIRRGLHNDRFRWGTPQQMRLRYYIRCAP